MAPRWHEACRVADVEAAAAASRGLHVNVAGAAITIFASRDGALSAVATPCPHAGHRLSNGHAADPADVEDLATGLGVLVQCPAHAYVYDTKSGACVAAFGGGAGAATVHAVKRVGAAVHVDLEPRPPASLPPNLTKDVRDRIGLRCVDLALRAKFGDDDDDDGD